MNLLTSLVLAFLAPACVQEPSPAARALPELDSAVEADGRRRWTFEGHPFTGPVHEAYDNGMRLTTSLVDGYEHGVQRLVFAHGVVAREVPMRAGHEHGRVRMWRADGRPYIVEYNKHGEPHGPQLRWSASGTVERSRFAIDGEDVGWSLDAIAKWEPAGTDAPAAHVAFWRAALLARDGKLQAALAEVTASFEQGYPTPMDAIGYGALAPLAADPGTRPRLVQLWLDHARESSVVMVGPEEPGTPLLLTIRLVDEATGEPMPGAAFRMQHTDDAGYYFPEDTLWNVRLYTATRADAEGRVRVRTILPGYYGAKFDPDGRVPRHIHFSAWAEGYRDYDGEARFHDDPRRLNDPEHALTIEMTTPEQGPQWGELTVPLQRRE